MKQWHYVESGEQRGPMSTTDLSRRVADRELGPDTLVWTEGMPEWTEIRKVPDFITSSPYTPPATETVNETVWDSYAASGPQIRPWVRYWARTFDFILFCMVAGMVLGLAYPPALELPDAALGIILLPFFALVEGAMFATLGTTPFKALLNVRVRNRNGARLSFPEGLRRAFLVWLRGLGMGIPIVTLITNYSSYKRLSASGAASWDSDGGYIVSHRKIGIWRLLVVIAFFGGFIALTILGQENPGSF